MISTIAEVAIPAAVMNGTPATPRPKIAITTVPPANTTRLPGRGDRPPGGVGNGRTLGEELAVPGDEEQGVVDSDAEPDHGGELGRPARDHHHMADERHRGHTEHQPEQGHSDRETHCDHRTEGDQQDHDRGGDPDHLGRAATAFFVGEEQIASALDPEIEVVACRGQGFLQLVQIADVEPFEDRVLDCEHRDRAVGRDRLVDAEHLVELGQPGAQLVEIGACCG